MAHSHLHRPTWRRARRAHIAASLTAVALLVAACGFDDEAGGDTTAPATNAPTTAATPTTGGGGAPSTDAPGTTFPPCSEPVVLGYMAPFGEGFSGQNATEVQDGMNIGLEYINEHGGILGGCDVEFVTGTENGEAGVGVSTAREMLGKGVRLFIGPGLTTDCNAAGPLFDEAGAMTLVSCVTTALTGPDRQVRNLYRIAAHDEMQAKAVAYVLAEEIADVKYIDSFGFDTAQGHSAWDTITASLADAGIEYEVPNNVFVPTSVTDFRPQIGAMANADVGEGKRVLVLLAYGPAALNFLTQAGSIGLLEEYDMILTTNQYYLPAVAMNGEAPEVWNANDTCHYKLHDNEFMTYLAEKLAAGNPNRRPSDWSVQGFNRMLLVAAAINKAGTTEPAAVMKAMDTISIDSAIGEITMDPDTHQARIGTSVCLTVGDKSEADGVRFIKGTIVPPEVTLD